MKLSSTEERLIEDHLVAERDLADKITGDQRKNK